MDNDVPLSLPLEGITSVGKGKRFHKITIKTFLWVKNKTGPWVCGDKLLKDGLTDRYID